VPCVLIILSPATKGTSLEGILDDKFVVYSNFDVSNILNEIKEDLEKYSVNDHSLVKDLSKENNLPKNTI